jgi:3-phenylpropionate/trans-cinnamate dioxygenase ferredoxin reductase subunit
MFGGYDQKVMRGRPEGGRFSVFFYRGGDLLAVNTVNQPAIFGAVRRLLNSGTPLDANDAADLNFDVEQLAPRRAKLDFERPWPNKSESTGIALDWGHA